MKVCRGRGAGNQFNVVGQPRRIAFGDQSDRLGVGGRDGQDPDGLLQGLHPPQAVGRAGVLRLPGLYLPPRDSMGKNGRFTVLEIIRERGRRGLPLERVYRCLFNPDLFLLAYGKHYRNKGAMTAGATAETVDGMNLGKIKAVIGALRQERYRRTPARRTYIDKKNSSKKRPLGLPTWSDKLLQEVLRLILKAYYEPASAGAVTAPRPARPHVQPGAAGLWPGTDGWISLGNRAARLIGCPGSHSRGYSLPLSA